VLFDSWYAALENLKKIRGYGWEWLCRLKANRLVNPDKLGNVAIEEVVEIPAEGRVVHLKGYGMVKVFRTVAKKKDGATRSSSSSTIGIGQPAMCRDERGEAQGTRGDGMGHRNLPPRSQRVLWHRAGAGAKH
jgi:putative transposase